MLNLQKKKLKKYYKTQTDVDLPFIDSFYEKLKISNQLFLYLTRKDQNSNFLKHQIQKIIYYLIKLLLRENLIHKENELKMKVSLTVKITIISSPHFLKDLENNKNHYDDEPLFSDYKTRL